MNQDLPIAIIGAGPAGLFAAETLANAGRKVTCYEQMPSAGRKFLMAGRGGLNLTHGEALESFLNRFGPDRGKLEPSIRAMTPEELRQWADALGADTFIGTSGRVFPRAMKASPLLRAWLRRLEGLGVSFKLRHRLSEIVSGTQLRFEAPDGAVDVRCAATVLACGGASWPRLGSDGGWAGLLVAKGVAPRPFEASNVGVRIQWSAHMSAQFGQPLKRLHVSCGEAEARGEAVITAHGLEGGAIYALSRPLRAALAAGAPATLDIDLRPDVDADKLEARLAASRKGETQSNALRRLAGLSAAAIGILREAGPLPKDPATLAARIKHARLTVIGLAGLDRAISSVGGVPFEAIDSAMMLKSLPGVFVCGEMLDWDAPTGGYLLQGCFSTAHAAAQGLMRFLDVRSAA